MEYGHGFELFSDTDNREAADDTGVLDPEREESVVCDPRLELDNKTENLLEETPSITGNTIGHCVGCDRRFKNIEPWCFQS